MVVGKGIGGKGMGLPVSARGKLPSSSSEPSFLRDASSRSPQLSAFIPPMPLRAPVKSGPVIVIVIDQGGGHHGGLQTRRGGRGGALVMRN
jgi:hypothetical protein